MRLDAPRFASAWLAVAVASATKDDAAALNRTLAIEEFPNGIRLVATDRFILLTAWVPHLDALSATEPLLHEAPDRTVIAYDRWKRGDSLFKFMLKLAKAEKEDVPEGDLEISVTFDERVPAGQAPDVFEGMETKYTVLKVTDRENVWLEVVEAQYPAWRGVLAEHHPQDTTRLMFNAERLQRITSAARWAPGPMTVTFGGTDRPVLVDFEESDPHVVGVIMPMRLTGYGLPEESTDGDVEHGDDPGNYDATTTDPEADADVAYQSLRDQGTTMTVSGAGPMATALRAVQARNDDSAVPEVDRDVLPQAVRLVVDAQYASGGLLRRKLGIGTPKADRLLAAMTSLGVIGDRDGTRTVLVDADAAEAILASIEGSSEPERLFCPLCDYAVEVSAEDQDASLSEINAHGTSTHSMGSHEYLTALHADPRNVE